MNEGEAAIVSPALHVHRGTRAVQRLVEYAPSTGGLALWIRHDDVGASAAATGAGRAPPALTGDGRGLRYGAAFERLPVERQAGLVAHQLLHVALRHPQRLAELQRLLGDVDLRLFNLCADAIVDSALSHLAWLALPADAVTLERLLAAVLGIVATAEAALLAWDVERLYRAVDDRDDGRRRDGRRDVAVPREDGPRAAKARALWADRELDLLPDDSERPEQEAELAREWRERLVRAHAGDAEFSMLRTLLADLPRPRTPWQQVLRTQLCRGLSMQPELSWSRPTRSWLANQGRLGGRRMPWEPGRSSGRRVSRLVVIVDVSGSIDAGLLARFGSEIAAIARRQEAGLVRIVGDDRVRRVDRFEPGRARWSELEVEGGGGTDFTPLLEEADRHRPDIGVVLTDLGGPARFEPAWPVIWAVPEAAAAEPLPFGRRLLLA